MPAGRLFRVDSETLWYIGGSSALSMRDEEFHFSWDISPCRDTRAFGIAEVLCMRAKTAGHSLEESSTSPGVAVAEQSQIFIKRPRVSGALLTIIPGRTCRV